jgi:putative ABC transport system substrate-binding protein
VNRRDFITGLAGAAVVGPRGALGQQSAVPVIGFVDVRGPDDLLYLLNGFRQGLKDEGFVEGENIAVLYRFANHQVDRFSELVADLVQRKVAVIYTSGGFQLANVAKQQSATIPIVFTMAEDPVRLGLVASLARPGANLTGVNFLSAELVAKRLELLRELVPRAARVAVLVNPKGPTIEITLRDVEVAAQSIGLSTLVVRASTQLEIDAAFNLIAHEKADALFVGTDPFFTARRTQMVNLASHHRLPASYSNRQFAFVGGLMTYGADVTFASRQSAIYVGRILKGTKPSELPVLQATKVELVINMQTARTLGIAVPQSLQVAADEVIE